MRAVHVIDSHTGGEPTRVVIDGGPDLGVGSFAEQFERFQQEHDSFRASIVNEPRGSDVLVGALLCEPTDASCTVGVMFFNNQGFLGMCGHGTIGLVATLAHLDALPVGTHRIETPAGVVTATLHEDGTVDVENVASYRASSGISVTANGSTFIGDVAYGGNWFFLTKSPVETINVDRAAELTSLAISIRQHLADAGITGQDGAFIDHVEFFTSPGDPQNDSRNFVLCPGGAYDRSPCGTGTSAKLACLAAEGKLQPGAVWRQESIVGSVFTGSYQWSDQPNHIIPTIRGRAFITSEATLLIDPADPFATGFSQ